MSSEKWDDTRRQTSSGKESAARPAGMTAGDDRVDLLEHPLVARHEAIVAVPTLVRLAPTPVRTIIGDLSDRYEVLDSLQIRFRYP